MTENGKEGVYVRLRGEVEPGPHVPARRGHPGGIPPVQPVARVLHVVLRLLGLLDIPLQVGLDLLQKRGTDALSYRQLLCPGHAIPPRPSCRPPPPRSARYS